MQAAADRDGSRHQAAKPIRARAALARAEARALILGLELRANVCGWSLLDEAASSFVGLGVHTFGRVGRVQETTVTRLDRVHGLAHVLAARAPGCVAIVLERWVPELVPELDIGLAWGSVLGVAAMMNPRPRLVTLDPHRWQREVLLGSRESGVDVAYGRAAYVLRGHPRADAALRAMPMREREPAVAAGMIALYGTLRLTKSKS
jgi:hypothetical protein